MCNPRRSVQPLVELQDVRPMLSSFADVSYILLPHSYLSDEYSMFPGVAEKVTFVGRPFQLRRLPSTSYSFGARIFRLTQRVG